MLPLITASYADRHNNRLDCLKARQRFLFLYPYSLIGAMLAQASPKKNFFLIGKQEDSYYLAKL
jgi:hypothetical protein